jgi:hypothetical protein
MNDKYHLKIGIVAIAIQFLAIGFCNGQINDAQKTNGIPQLVKQGNATQLFVNEKPFLIIGGELNNSSSSSIAYMKPIWEHVNALNFNTVLAPLSWELIEPQEGKFDFNLVDSLIVGARQNHLHLVFLWLASWKNGMSSYAPLWVKENYKKYPRAKFANGYTMEVLSPLSHVTAEADARAFSVLMKHIREFDGATHTVLMMQVENEVGILGDSRDHSEIANKAFKALVPRVLMDYLIKNKDNLVPELKCIWGQNDFKKTGSWEEIFGKGTQTDEIFMAWNYARYINTVASSGKGEYPIPMYVNAWLNQPSGSTPGSYPSGGPLPHVFDIWQAGAPSVNMMAPDLYVSDFVNRCQKFTQCGNPLFIPEMNSSDDGARNIFIAIGKYNAIGVSPFGIDRTPEKAELGKSYSILEQLSPIILEKQKKGEITGFVLDEKTPIITCKMGGYNLEISLDELFGHKSKIGYGIVMTDGKNQFMGAGSGFRVRFFPETKGSDIIGIGSIEEGTFDKGVWIPGRHLNGDEDDQGRAWRFNPWSLTIETCSVYSYK